MLLFVGGDRVRKGMVVTEEPRDSTVKRAKYGEREERKTRKGRRRTVSKLHLVLLLQRRARHCALRVTFLNNPAGSRSCFP